MPHVHLVRWTRLYFIQVVGDGPIKIGISDAPGERLLALQSACPYELRLLGHVPARVGLERWLHQRFAADRLRGEWFEPADDLLRLIGYLFEILEAA